MALASRSTLTRRSRSRLTRRASASAFLSSQNFTESKTNGLSHSTSMKSRRNSFAPLSSSPPSFNWTTVHGEPYHDTSEDEFVVKKENRSPSPTFLASPQARRASLLQERSPKQETLAYASLPPSPISPSPEPLSPPLSSAGLSGFDHQPIDERIPFSLWDYLREELLATDFDSHQELKWERVSNFLNVPIALEKILGFGFVLCFDSFLHTFTILPIRFALAVYRLIPSLLFNSKKPFPPSQKSDILRALLLVISILILIPMTDASRIYHSIRGQDTIKLYVIFNALEIADRLCSSFGQDILDCVFSRSTLLLLSRKAPLSSHTLRPFMFFVIALLYTVAHTLVLVYQLISLNVAINSFDHALLTLLVSNQFVEIKGSVFKKFEKDNLFQITCADIVERFTLSLMLFTIAFRNLIELSGSEFDFSEGVVLPLSFGWFKGGNVLWTILYPVMTVLISEQFVDWLKHAFITKFNHIRPSVYERYTDVLCLDLANGSAVGRRVSGARKHSYVDQSPIVARRLGFPALPLAVLAALIGSQSVGIVISAQALHPASLYVAVVARGQWIALGVLFWFCCVVVKIIIGVNLVSYATRRRADMEDREEADKINDFGRDPIGEGKDEREYNRGLKTMLSHSRDDMTPVPDIGELSASDKASKGAKRRPQLEELTRFTMVKRIW